MRVVEIQILYQKVDMIPKYNVQASYPPSNKLYNVQCTWPFKIKSTLVVGMVQRLLYMFKRTSYPPLNARLSGPQELYLLMI